MKRDETVIAKAKEEINQRKDVYEEEYFSLVDASSEVDIIKRVFPNGVIDYSVLKDVSKEDYAKLLNFLIKDDEELIKLLGAAQYVVKYDIGLVKRQSDALEMLIVMANSKLKEISDVSSRKDALGKNIKDLNELKNDLDSLGENDIVDLNMLDKIFSVLGIDEESKADYLEKALLFNLEQFNKLNGLDLGLDKFDRAKDSKKAKKDETFGVEELEQLFSRYGYNFSAFDQNYVDALLNRGNLEQYTNIFEALKSNDVPFAKESAKSLTQFLIYSKPEIIENMCNIFKENGIMIEDAKGYITAFFPGGSGKPIENGGGGGWNPDDLYIKGTYDNFIENYLYVKENFQCDMKWFLEKESMLLIASHEKLVKNIGKLALYGIILEDGKKSYTLTATRPMDNADRLIEVGEESYIYKYPTILTKNCDLISRRIYACNFLGYDYHSKHRDGAFLTSLTRLDKPLELPSEAAKDGVSGGEKIIVPQELISNNGFVVPDYALELLESDKYKMYSNILKDAHPDQVSSETYEDPIVKSLDNNYKATNGSYVIDGTIISRKKFLRNYEFLMKTKDIPDDKKNLGDILLVSAISNSLLSEVEVEKISKVLGNSIKPEGGNYGLSTK